MSRTRSRARKRAFNRLGWADQRKIISASEDRATRKASTPQPKPEWVLSVESGGHQNIGGDRRKSSVSGLTRSQRDENRALRKSRPAVANPHTDYVRQTRTDGRSALMAGAGRPKLLTLPLGTVTRASLRPEYRKPKSKPSPYTR